MNNANNLSPTVSNKTVDSYELDIKEQVLKFALENSNIGAWDYDAITQNVFYSKESKNILGFEDHEIGTTAKEWNDRVHPEDKEHYFQDFHNHLIGINTDYVNEHRIQCKDGSYKWILDRGRVIERDIYGKPTRIIGTHTDISERKEQEEKISRNQNIIKDQNKRLKNFALIVTHNLKSHTANFESLLGFLDDAKDEDEKNEIITHIKTVNNSLTETISNLNKIVTTQASRDQDIQTINIHNYVVNTINLLEVELKANKSIVNINLDKDLHLQYNPAYFESIIQNLLSNTIKYRHPDRTPVVNINSEVTPEHIILKISDNGLGIDLDKYGDDIFELYRTFHNNKNAEGVGLYLTKDQIEAFDGTIELESTVNVGTTFTIKFPNKKSLAN
ncbi:PAS domain-containing protein [Lacinutrix sp. WUR7]|uniref:sensor histidine kinase n=1 Tax=Lacinutrix sp. WUR7 TaxID=2653681 RepID=UPI00193CBBDC|nr:PAS domain-containing sensor histidine kinase [Lacinutrix sp. WUR7]QRM90504.1 PAS domain-containing protein [Lacinutrix sp. WUR7]